MTLGLHKLTRNDNSTPNGRNSGGFFYRFVERRDRMMKRVFNLAFIGLVALTLASCTSQMTQYPSEWPALSRGKDDGSCIDLTGAYSNIGDLASTQSYKSWVPLLSNQFDLTIRENKIAPEKITEVRITGVNNKTLELRLQENDVTVYSTTLSADREFSCGPDHISIRSTSPIPHAMKASTTVYTKTLRKSADKSLIVSSTTHEVGLSLFIVPYAERSREWYRFKSVE